MYCEKCGSKLESDSKFCTKCGTAINGTENISCPYCGSKNIEIGVAWGKSAETGNVGLKYETGWLVGVVQVYTDLCLDCKSIVRS